MTSFYTLPLEFLTHEPDLIISFITSTRPFLNCSIVPTILSDENLWASKLSRSDHSLKWYRLFILSDTMQFASKMLLPQGSFARVFADRILSPLLQDQHPISLPLLLPQTVCNSLRRRCISCIPSCSCSLVRNCFD